MLKEPRPGRVKTRLGRDIGMTRAAWWFRHQAASLLRNIQDPRWDTILAVSPDIDGLNSRIWPPNLLRMPQGGGSLGDRMGRVFRTFPPGPLCIVGADIPQVRNFHLAEAFDALGRNDAVFGPASDGGYWLIGLKRVRAIPPGLFHNVRWSSQHALNDTRDSLQDHSVATVATLSDVDTAEDLHRFAHDAPAGSC
ncbi:MAG: TIGR04282 family arsenosugar biosynthesis glycosyltransferase [Paracoccaceae bacterium]